MDVGTTGLIDLYYQPAKLERLSQFRYGMRAYVAELIGTLILVMFGCGTSAQVTFHGTSRVIGSLILGVGWALGLILGTLIAGPLSGAHLNPAVTIGCALFGKFNWKKVPGYIASQFTGGFLAAVIVYIFYWPLFDRFDGGTRQVFGKKGTANIFFTQPHLHVPNYSSFITELLLTVILAIGTLSITNSKYKIPNWGVAFSMGSLYLAIGIAFGSLTGYAMNPARDIGPRIFAAMAGWGSKVFTIQDYYFVIPFFAPFLGAPLGVAIYDFFIDPRS